MIINTLRYGFAIGLVAWATGASAGQLVTATTSAGTLSVTDYGYVPGATPNPAPMNAYGQGIGTSTGSVSSYYAQATATADGLQISTGAIYGPDPSLAAVDFRGTTQPRVNQSIKGVLLIPILTNFNDQASTGLRITATVQLDATASLGAPFELVYQMKAVDKSGGILNFSSQTVPFAVNTSGSAQIVSLAGLIPAGFDTAEIDTEFSIAGGSYDAAGAWSARAMLTSLSITPLVVPEASTAAMSLLGLMALGAIARRQRLG